MFLVEFRRSQDNGVDITEKTETNIDDVHPHIYAITSATHLMNLCNSLSHAVISCIHG